MTFLNEEVRREVALRVCRMVCDNPATCAQHAWAREQTAVAS